MLTGGGTGGHITPILAVAHELKRIQPDIRIIYIGERHSKYAEMTAKNSDIDEIHSIFAGKFRRYHGESWLYRIADIKTNLLNLRDLFYFLLGTIQAMLLLKRLSPDAVLLKGGFVGVPTGLASALWKIPFVTHDSDALPGLANRMVAKWAKYHATALPADKYSYPVEDVKQVGVLVGEEYGSVSDKKQTDFREEIGLPKDATVLLITGGSGGASNINTAAKKLLPKLLEDYPKLYVVHQVGKGKAGVYDGYNHDRLLVGELFFPLYQYTGSADVVVTRAGANAIAELGVQGRACIVIPNPLLTGGHQVKNAQQLEKQGAAVIVDETTLLHDTKVLDLAIRDLLDNRNKRSELGKRLQEITIPDATQKLAKVLLGSVNKE